jgi:hypothetical protein
MPYTMCQPSPPTSDFQPSALVMRDAPTSWPTLEVLFLDSLEGLFLNRLSQARIVDVDSWLYESRWFDIFLMTSGDCALSPRVPYQSTANMLCNRVVQHETNAGRPASIVAGHWPRVRIPKTSEIWRWLANMAFRRYHRGKSEFGERASPTRTNRPSAAPKQVLAALAHYMGFDPPPKREPMILYDAAVDAGDCLIADILRPDVRWPGRFRLPSYAPKPAPPHPTLFIL